MSDAHLLPGSWYSSSGDPASFLGGSGLMPPRQGWGDPEQLGSHLLPESVGGEISYFMERNLSFPSGIRPSGGSWSAPAVLTHPSSSQRNGRQPRREGT